MESAPRFTSDPAADPWRGYAAVRAHLRGLSTVADVGALASALPDLVGPRALCSMVERWVLSRVKAGEFPTAMAR